MNTVLKALLLILPFGLLTACGGGGSSSNAEIDNGPDFEIGDSVVGVEPIAAFSSSGTSERTVGNQTITVVMKSGFDTNSDIEAKVYDNGDGTYEQVTELAAGIPSMNVNDIQRTEAYDILCSNGDDIRGTISTDFSTGEQVSSGIVNGQTLECFSEYVSVLPRTVSTNENSIDELILGFGEEGGQFSTLITTDCPEDEEVIATPDLEVAFCDGTILNNVVVTDSFGVKHKFVHQSQLNYSN